MKKFPMITLSVSSKTLRGIELAEKANNLYSLAQEYFFRQEEDGYAIYEDALECASEARKHGCGYMLNF